MKSRFIQHILITTGALWLFTILWAQKHTAVSNFPGTAVTKVATSEITVQPAKGSAYQTVSIGYGSSQTQACSMDPETRFMDDNPGYVTTNEQVFWTPALTLPITGRKYFTDGATGKIWNVDPTTGIIGTFTGNYCP